MLSAAPMCVRRGLTLVELVAAMVVAGVVLAVVTNIAVRQQRAFVALTNDAALAGQLRDAASMLPMDVRGAAIAAGDLHEASDTSIEIRETIASGVVCDTLGSMVVLAPSGPGAATFAGSVAAMQAGDTAWLLAWNDSMSTWRSHRVTAVGSTHAGQCLAGGPQLSASALGTSRTTLLLDSTPVAATLVGLPARVTRPIRYSLYRSADGNWYLGARDWNVTGARFNSIQPIAGPFQAPKAGAPAFRWFDTTGAVLPAPVVARGQIALLWINLQGQTLDVDRVLGAAAEAGLHRDSVSISVSVRNRP